MNPKSRRLVQWGFLAALALAGASGGTALSQEFTDEKPPPVTDDPLEDPRLVEQRPLLEAADSLDAIAEDREIGRFLSVRIDHERGGITVFVHDKAIKDAVFNSALREIELSDDIPVLIRFTEYTADELDAEARRILDLDPTQIDGVRVTAAGPTENYDGVIVSVDPADLSKAEQSIQSQYPLSFEGMALSEPIGRWDDVPPFWAGAGADRVADNGYEYCTPGFSAFRPGGEEVMIFPRHCGAGNWYTPSSDRFLGETSGATSAATDSKMLRLANYGPAMWTGPWGNTGTGRFVSGARNPADESFVLISGSQSGGHVVKVRQVGQYIDMPVGNGLTVRVGPGFWTVDQEGDGSAGNGDSGGPVATSNSSGYMIARGMMDTVDLRQEAPCEGRRAINRRCSARSFSVNIRAVLDAHDLTIQQLQ